MSRKRRGEEIELNFDGLTDSVTDLVGSLILLVVLVIGITSDAVSHSEPHQPDPPATREAGDRSITTLQQRITLLQTQIREVDRDISQAKTRISEAQDEVERLIEKVQKIQIPQPQQPAEKPREEPPRKVLFRPPFERFDASKEEVTFVLENGRVSLLDFKAVTSLVKSKTAGKKDQKVDFRDNIPGTDFRLEGWTKGDDLDLTVVRQENQIGEGWEQLKQPNSRFRQKLAALDPQKHIIDMTVYPDSFETYRQVRALAWSAQFEVGWMPNSAGQPIRLGVGTGVGGTSQ